ncbi:MAG: hypothetical protein ACTIKT_06980 [Microbacterium sp.]
MRMQTLPATRATNGRKIWQGAAVGIALLAPVAMLLRIKTKSTTDGETMSDAARGQQTEQILDLYQTRQSMQKFGWLLVAIGIGLVIIAMNVSSTFVQIVWIVAIAVLLGGIGLIMAAMVTGLRADRLAIDNGSATVEGITSNIRRRNSTDR